MRLKIEVLTEKCSETEPIILDFKFPERLAPTEDHVALMAKAIFSLIPDSHKGQMSVFITTTPSSNLRNYQPGALTIVEYCEHTFEAYDVDTFVSTLVEVYKKNSLWR